MNFVALWHVNVNMKFVRKHPCLAMLQPNLLARQVFSNALLFPVIADDMYNFHPVHLD
jgi:hypothetical protein